MVTAHASFVESVFEIMKDGIPRNLEELAKITGKERKVVVNALTYLRSKGYMDHVKHGVYQGKKGMTYKGKSRDTSNRIAPAVAGGTLLCDKCATLSTLRESLITAQKANIKMKLHYKEELRRLRRKYSAFAAMED